MKAERVVEMREKKELLSRHHPTARLLRDSLSLSLSLFLVCVCWTAAIEHRRVVVVVGIDLNGDVYENR